MSSGERKGQIAFARIGGPRRKERPPPNERRGPGAGDRAFLEKTKVNSNTQPLNPSRFASQAEIVADLRFQRDFQEPYRLGPRVVYEFLVELGRDCLISIGIETKIERNTDRLSPELLRDTGGDRFPAEPIHLVDVGHLLPGREPQ